MFNPHTPRSPPCCTLTYERRTVVILFASNWVGRSGHTYIVHQTEEFQKQTQSQAEWEMTLTLLQTINNVQSQKKRRDKKKQKKKNSLVQSDWIEPQFVLVWFVWAGLNTAFRLWCGPKQLHRGPLLDVVSVWSQRNSGAVHWWWDCDPTSIRPKTAGMC